MTRTLYPLTILFALASATTLGVAISPILPPTSPPPTPAATCTIADLTKVRATRHEVSARRQEAGGCREERGPGAARSKLFHHLRYHQRFPADRQAVLGAMRGTAEVTEGELTWLAGRLEAGEYRTAAEVMRAAFPVAPSHVVLALSR